MPGPVRDLRAQDLPVGRGTQSGRVEGVEEDGCRLGVRIPLPTGGLEQALPLCSSLLRESARGSGAGAVSRRRASVMLYEEMRVGPSESPCRRRLQTARSCFSQKLRW